MLKVISLMKPPHVILSSRVSPASKWRIWGKFYIWQLSCKDSQELTHHNPRTHHLNDAVGSSIKEPSTFRKLQAILVQVKIYAVIVGPRSTIGREGDGIEARGEASEDTRVEVKHSTPTSRAILIVEVGQEGVKCHSLGRCEGTRVPGRDENYGKVAKRWVCQSIIRIVGSHFFPQRFLHLRPQVGY